MPTIFHRSPNANTVACVLNQTVYALLHIAYVLKNTLRLYLLWSNQLNTLHFSFFLFSFLVRIVWSRIIRRWRWSYGRCVQRGEMWIRRHNRDAAERERPSLSRKGKIITICIFIHRNFQTFFFFHPTFLAAASSFRPDVCTSTA